jgi:hypothetical protein
MIDEDVPDQDAEYLEYLANQAASHNGGESDFEDFDEEEIEEEILFESPLDEIDPYVRFEEVFRGLQQSNTASYTLLTKDLTAEQQTQIMNVLNAAEQHRNKPAEPTA